MIWTLLGFVFSILCFTAFKGCDFSQLGFYSGDEVGLQHALQNMWAGLTQGNIKLFFNTIFYNYGFPFFLSNFLVTLPFLHSGPDTFTVVIPRVLTALCSTALIGIFYRFSRHLGAEKNISLLLASFPLTFPSFWIDGSAFQVDMICAFLIIWSFTTFLDSPSEIELSGRAPLLFALACSCKIQSLLLIPFFPLILLCTKTNLKNFIFQMTKLGITVLSVFFLTNPQLLHPQGRNAYLWNLHINLESNRTNHWTHTPTTIGEKINLISDSYISLPSLLMLIVAMALFLFFTFRKNTLELFRQHTIRIAAVSFSGLFAILFMIFSINKLWPKYYLTPALVFWLSFVLLFAQADKTKLFRKKHQIIFLIAALLINLGMHQKQIVQAITKSHIHPQ